MISIDEVRKKYPGYSDLSDDELADKLHIKFYSDMPKQDFYQRIGLQSSPDSEIDNKPSWKKIGNTALDEILGAGDFIQNMLATPLNKINGQEIVPLAHSSSGQDYDLGRAIGGIASTSATGGLVSGLGGKLPYLSKALEGAGTGASVDYEHPVKGAIVGSILGAAPELLGKMTSFVKNALHYINPKKSANEYVNSLGSGTSTENIAELSKIIQKTRDSEKAAALKPKEKLFMTEKNSIIVPKNNGGNYLNIPKVTKGYDEGLEQLHNNYKMNPTLENADLLKSSLSKEARRLKTKINTNIYQESDKLKLDRIKQKESSLTKDMDNFSSTLSPKKQNYYNNFRTKWAKQQEKYEPANSTSKNDIVSALSEGEHKGLMRENINSAFKSPDKHISKVLQDIGQQGNQKVLYNKLLNVSPNNPEELANALIQARRAGGYEHYISPKTEDFANELLKRALYRFYANKTGMVLGGMTALGGLGSGIAKHYLKGPNY